MTCDTYNEHVHRNGSSMNMFINEPFINEHVHKNRFINEHVDLNRFIDEHVKYNSSSHPFRRRSAGVVAFLHACQAKIALNNRYISFI